LRPIQLPPNSVPRFYRGGAQIAALRGIEIASERAPEEWVGSATTVFGERELGLSRLADGRLLRDALAADPVDFFGPDHADRHGADPQLLVKLLDAGERLPVHVHPDGPFARTALDSPYGKTEAWIVLATAGRSATVHLGFRDDLSAATLESWVRDRDAQAMLDALNPVELVAGDALFVPAGIPHAIGAGVLLAELQEPSDLSILLEWEGFASGEQDASLGLGWDVALDCVERSRCDPDRLRGRRGAGANGATSLLPSEADSFFRAERIEASPAAELARGFAILVFVEGAAELHCEDGDPLAVSRGDTVLVPWAAGTCRLEGDAVAVACRPPATDRAGGPE
jgi:mannose-6-phosphate isomerase